MYKEQLIDTIYESNYEKAHREALARPVPFDTCRQCSRYNGGCTIGFKLKRVGIHFVYRDWETDRKSVV